MKDFKTIGHYTNKEKRMRTLHIETEGCIVNIRVGLIDRKEREVTSVEIIPDKYSGEAKRKLIGSLNNRIIKLKKIE